MKIDSVISVFSVVEDAEETAPPATAGRATDTCGGGYRVPAFLARLTLAGGKAIISPLDL